MHERQRRVRQGKRRIEPQCALIQLLCDFEVRALLTRPPPVVEALQVELIRLGVPRGHRGEGARLGAGERGPEPAHDPLRDVALDREGVLQRPVVVLRPEPRLANRLNELHDHPQPIPRDLHATLDDAADAELLADLA
jgi:hypothetical protein